MRRLYSVSSKLIIRGRLYERDRNVFVGGEPQGNLTNERHLTYARGKDPFYSETSIYVGDMLIQ